MIFVFFVVDSITSLFFFAHSLEIHMYELGIDWLVYLLLTFFEERNKFYFLFDKFSLHYLVLFSMA